MLSPTSFRNLVSGRQKGVGATLFRTFLRLVETPYTWAVVRRNRRFDRGATPIHRVDVPIVSVGNLTLGGTGKTPTVEWLARWFREKNIRAAIISRGYGAESGSRNDEARELEQKLPDVPHLQNPDRVAAARVAVEELDMQLILLDDGFQHRRIGRDLDIVLLDALEPFGFEHVFPRGTLREPIIGLKRADVILLSRADAIQSDQREYIRRRIEKIAPAAIWGEVAHAPVELINASGEIKNLAEMQTNKIVAFCGLGNPTGFRHTLERCDYRLADFLEFPDHHPYARHDLEKIAAWVENNAADVVLCSHKDLVKIGVDRIAGKPLWAVRVAIQFLAGQDALEKRLLALLQNIPNPVDDVY